MKKIDETIEELVLELMMLGYKVNTIKIIPININNKKFNYLHFEAPIQIFPLSLSRIPNLFIDCYINEDFSFSEMNLDNIIGMQLAGYPDPILQNLDKFKNLYILSVNKARVDYGINILPDSLTYLSITNSIISKIITNLKNPKLRSINLSGCIYNINKVNFQQIARIKSLKLLDLSLNQLPMLPDEIQYLNNLQFLYLKNNELNKLPNLSGLISLKVLDLSENLFRNFPDAVCDLPVLQELNLSDNMLSVIPYTINRLQSLKYLNLSRCNISTCNFGNLNQLQILILQQNKIEKIKECIDGMRNLRTLNLRVNNIHSFPTQINNLTFIEKIDLSRNYIQGAYFDFTRLKNIKSINLTNNQLQYIKFKGTSETLLELNLSLNKIKDLNNIVFYCPNLRKLGIIDNKIKDLSPICELKFLVELGASYNKIDKIPDNIQNLKKLNVLSIDGNNIKNIPWNLSLLDNLQTFTASYNDLETITEEFGNMTNLLVLSFEGNKKLKLPDSITKLTKLQYFYLDLETLKNVKGKIKIWLEEYYPAIFEHVSL